MTQGERILIYIRTWGSISPMEAFEDLGITKLASRIGELKQKGFEFEQHFETRQNRYGEKRQFMRYSLKEPA